MTRTQKTIFIALAVLIALTRLVAIARSPFDWDEALFTLGVRDYNVVDHHPHPPGYPLFIVAAKVFHLLGVPEFRSLQVVVVLGGMLLFPALFFLAREIGFDFTTSTGGAAVFTFLPNVWVYGGTGFSDVPATAIGFVACALLLRGRRNPRMYVLGAVVLGIAAGFRPTNLMLGVVPALIATWHHRKSLRHVFLAIFLGGVIAAGSYVGAALASGSVEGYRVAVREQSKWVREVDSFRNPGRPALHDVAKTFFLWPIDQRQQMVGLAALGVISLITAIVKRRTPPLLTFVIFLPFAIIAWLNLDVQTAARYAIAYMATHALLAADGLGVLAARRERVHAVLCFVVASVFIVWTWPALALQRTSDSPPIAALQWIRKNVPNDRVFVHGGIGPQAEVYIPNRPNTVYFDEPEQVSLMAGEAWIVDLKEVRGARNFVWPRNALWKIVRRRNFESSIGRASSIIRFGEGWHGDEGGFRWMKGEAAAALPAIRGKGKVALRIYVPLDTLPSPPMLEVRFNGVTLERFVGSPADISKSWIVDSRAGEPNELRILTSATVNPAALGRSQDSRDLGLRIDGLSWTPVQ